MSSRTATLIGVFFLALAAIVSILSALGCEKMFKPVIDCNEVFKTQFMEEALVILPCEFVWARPKEDMEPYGWEYCSTPGQMYLAAEIRPGVYLLSNGILSCSEKHVRARNAINAESEETP